MDRINSADFDPAQLRMPKGSPGSEHSPSVLTLIPTHQRGDLVTALNRIG